MADANNEANGAEAGAKQLKIPDTVVTALLLLPGFVTERVADYFSSSPKLSDVELVATALAATIINLMVTYLLWHSLAELRFATRHRFGLLVSNSGFLVTLFAVSIGTGLIWAELDSHNVLFRMGLTSRVSRADPWETAFNKNAERSRPLFVRVITKDKSIYHGQPWLFSQGTGGRSLVLDQAQRELPRADDTGQALDRLSSGRCVPVGLDVVGRVFIPNDQIEIVEFRPKVLVNNSCEYSCDSSNTRKPCQD